MKGDRGVPGSVRVIEVIEVIALRGSGVLDDLRARQVRRYHDPHTGELLAEHDPFGRLNGVAESKEPPGPPSGSAPTAISQSTHERSTRPCWCGVGRAGEHRDGCRGGIDCPSCGRAYPNHCVDCPRPETSEDERDPIEWYAWLIPEEGPDPQRVELQCRRPIIRTLRAAVRVWDVARARDKGMPAHYLETALVDLGEAIDALRAELREEMR